MKTNTNQSNTNQLNLRPITVKQHKPIAADLDCQIVSDRKVNLTSELAFRFLEMSMFEGERPVNERRVQSLYDAYCSGRFMWEQAIIGIARIKDKAYRVNGQHTCWMRTNIKEKNIECMVRELVYEVPDEHNLRMLYTTFDQGMPRTTGHNFKVIIAGTAAAAGLRPSILVTLQAGFRLWQFSDRAYDLQRSTADIATIIMEQYPQLFQMVGLFTQANIEDFPSIKRAAVIGAMFATFEASPNKATEFWNSICNGLGLTQKTDARWQLRKFIESHSHQHSVSSGSKIPVTAEELFRICIQAWNRWRRGEVVSLLRANDKRVKAV